MNLLTNPLISASTAQRLSLPGLLAAMACSEVTGFPALRPHQRPAWHMFLVQLAALALWTAKREDLPDDAGEWTDLLRALTPNHKDDCPWRMVVEDDAQPAFLQPPAPAGLKWSPVPTPDALDLLITARNHDIKQSVARHVQLEDWLFALVSLQTSAGYDGAGNYGIARMNGGSSSRPMMGLVPAHVENYRINSSKWWRRDVERLLHERRAGNGSEFGSEGGPALLWCPDWPEGSQLDLRTLDPWFIEVCRRVRFVRSEQGLSAVRAVSKAARIDAKVYRGHVGDPWAPVHISDRKSLTLAGGNFDYRRLADLLFGGEWKVPLLATLGAGEAVKDSVLVAEALSRGNSKTEGFKSRMVPVPDRAVRLFRSDAAGKLSKFQLDEIKAFDEALRNALALLAGRGDWDNVRKGQYASSRSARERFDRAADRLFFPHLWRRLVAENSGDTDAQQSTGRAFRLALLDAANAELEASMSSIPCATIQRPRAEARARRAFRSRVWKLDSQLQQTGKQEDIDAEL